MIVVPFAKPSNLAYLAVISLTFIVSRIILLTLVPNISVFSSLDSIVLLIVTSISLPTPKFKELPPEPPPLDEPELFPTASPKILDTSVRSDLDFIKLENDTARECSGIHGLNVIDISRIST